MKKRSAFRLNGKRFNPELVPPGVLKIRKACMGLKDGELIQTNELAALAGYTYRSIRAAGFVTHVLLLPHRAKIRFPSICVVWGNAKTIRKLLKHKELLA